MSLLESTVSIMANVDISWPNLEKEAQRWGTGHPTLVPYAPFPTKDTFFVIGAVNDRPFETLLHFARPEACPCRISASAAGHVNGRVGQLSTDLDLALTEFGLVLGPT
ncbi:hypothetical protein SPBR_09171 [Sporothrix brasiliensis 5110]|uniref:Uncharacterized protein n=1 Tax=Sporothrix brasiliensis 5110 TaxID=1398154 RepID=A0A0C2J2L9_9PEZI|nr:uncharacterized protein SPBR_09171 [Sporothrix brasiliensis 5110]KIH93285.1 hypothetical protein SPBR_09171 [Sporothrix brasiliensis 5110]